MRHLSAHGIESALNYPHLARFWVGHDLSLHLRTDGKLDVNMRTGPGPDDVAHVMRRYKNGKGWIDGEYIDEALNRLSKHMVLDDLASI